MTTIKMLSVAVLIAMSSVAANAANRISYSSTWTGDWCMSRVEDGWAYFNRGVKTCEVDAGLTLKRNGDYVLSVDGHDERCKEGSKKLLQGLDGLHLHRRPRPYQKAQPKVSN
jgi:hypothetical protein